ncbi:MAG: hypothetical protein RLZZ292_3424 [Bacteroidota bacterium]
MKKILLGLFAVAMLAFVACQKESVTATSTVATTASKVATTTDLATATDGTTLALIGTNTPMGKPKKISFDSLPTTIQKYLITNIDTATIKVIIKNVSKKDGTTTYVVILKDGTRLYFDAEGNKIDAPTPTGPGTGGGPGGNGGGGPHHGGPGGGGNGEPGTGPGNGGGEPTGACAGTAPEKIAAEALPAAALDYIKATYPNAEIKDAVKITKADCTVNYIVRLKDGDKPKIVIFDEKGGVIKK